jgi:hypothetical protein
MNQDIQSVKNGGYDISKLEKLLDALISEASRFSGAV